MQGAILELASSEGDDVGFLLVILDRSALEVVYLATDPATWGRGVGSRLLARVDELAHEHDAAELSLWVIDDNHRALAVYEAAGWRDTGARRPHESVGRTERLLRRRLG